MAAPNPQQAHVEELFKYMASVTSKPVIPTPQTMLWFTFLMERLIQMGDCVEGMNRLQAAPPLPGDFAIPADERCRVAWNLLLFRVYAVSNLLATLVTRLQLPALLEVIDRIPCFEEQQRVRHACRLLMCELLLYEQPYAFTWMDGHTNLPWIFAVEYQTGVAVGDGHRTGNDQAMALHSAGMVHHACLQAIFTPWDPAYTRPSCRWSHHGVAEENITTCLLRADDAIRIAITTVALAIQNVGSGAVDAYDFVCQHQLMYLCVLHHTMVFNYAQFREQIELQDAKECVMDIHSVCARELRYIRDYGDHAEPFLIPGLQVPFIQASPFCALGPVSCRKSMERYRMPTFAHYLNGTATEWSIASEIIMLMGTSAIVLPMHDIWGIYEWWYRVSLNPRGNYYDLPFKILYNRQSSEFLQDHVHNNLPVSFAAPPITLNVTPFDMAPQLMRCCSAECMELYRVPPKAAAGSSLGTDQQILDFRAAFSQ